MLKIEAMIGYLGWGSLSSDGASGISSRSNKSRPGTVPTKGGKGAQRLFTVLG
jgi:hypothetical protein